MNKIRYISIIALCCIILVIHLIPFNRYKEEKNSFSIYLTYELNRINLTISDILYDLNEVLNDNTKMENLYPILQVKLRSLTMQFDSVRDISFVYIKDDDIVNNSFSSKILDLSEYIKPQIKSDVLNTNLKEGIELLTVINNILEKDIKAEEKLNTIYKQSEKLYYDTTFVTI